MMLKSRYLCGGSVMAVALALGGQAFAQQASTVEEVVVTGSFIRGTPEDAAGFAESNPHSYVVDFLSSTEGLSLNKSFVRIKDARVRRRIVDLVQTLAAEEGEA